MPVRAVLRAIAHITKWAMPRAAARRTSDPAAALLRRRFSESYLCHAVALIPGWKQAIGRCAAGSASTCMLSNG